MSWRDNGTRVFLCISTSSSWHGTMSRVSCKRQGLRFCFRHTSLWRRAWGLCERRPISSTPHQPPSAASVPRRRSHARTKALGGWGPAACQHNKPELSWAELSPSRARSLSRRGAPRDSAEARRGQRVEREREVGGLEIPARKISTAIYARARIVRYRAPSSNRPVPALPSSWSVVGSLPSSPGPGRRLRRRRAGCGLAPAPAGEF
jgi:hypothetical protein